MGCFGSPTLPVLVGLRGLARVKLLGRAPAGSLARDVLLGRTPAQLTLTTFSTFATGSTFTSLSLLLLACANE